MSVPEILFSEMARRVAEGDPIATIFNKVGAAQRSGKDIIALAAGPPDSRELPSDDFKAIVDDVPETFGTGFLNYNRPAGLPQFVETVSSVLREEGVVIGDPMANVLATSGGSEAISLAAQALLNPGDVVIVESPAFAGALSTLRLAGAKIVHIECDGEGMTPDALQAAIKEYSPKLVSVMPDFQNPTGKVMSLKRRKAVADILAKAGIFAVEDGAYSMLRFAGEKIPPLQSLAPDNVIYVTSVSKTFAPAERLGVMIAPEKIIEVAASMKSAFNMQASALLQELATIFVSPKSNYLKNHLLNLMPKYAERREAMGNALQEYLPDTVATRPDGGMFIWVELDGVDFDELFDVALEHGVAYVPGSMFYAEKSRAKNCARLNFASNTPEEIQEGVRRLADAIKSVRQPGSLRQAARLRRT